MIAALRHPLARAGLVLLLGTAVYANTRWVPYLFDDPGSIPNNPTIRTLSRAVFSPPREETVSSRPISNASFALNRAITGDSLAGFHLGNILVHLAAALLLLGLVRRTLRRPQFRFGDRADVLATIIALLWVAHPIETESVTYLVQRVESAAGLFILLTLYASMRAATDGFGWSLVAIVAYPYTPRNGVQGGRRRRPRPRGPVRPRVSFPLLSEGFRRWLLCRTCRRVTTVGSLIAEDARHRTAGLRFQHFGSWDYLRIKAGAVVHYLRLIIWPYPLIFDYGEPNDGVPLATRLIEWGPPAALLVVLLGASLLAWRRWPGIGFLGISFFILLGPS